ncbi:hypothetical protein MNEG_8338 [Monoraphidium neglectum]|uniref:Uncharacterized protein n=1 Tax=Monoraphidium neglectum TaxID=145388 RepID=A0A0D2MG11_9CHLO|nr:hypothetical protein MNEG_8338 [Monoraphidium neglectum]KIY99621.1 hypothetical protein MNEG_8338 [Monoraphidium neglectum]|eukprot:XP_013898641.1 hypothetical protein MNEG_8338 [Monoraphidium neglectum]
MVKPFWDAPSKSNWQAWLDDLDLSTPSKGNQWYTLLRRGRKPEDFAALKKTFDAQLQLTGVVSSI